MHKTDIKHSVLTGGAPVLAAGEAMLYASGGTFHLLDITNNSGHFKPSPESLEIGRQAFIRDGVLTSFK